jgi:N4-gp56 family major capsid protein
MVEHYNDRRLLETLYPNLPFHQFGDKKPLPKREGEGIKWRQWHVLKKGRLLAESGAGPGTSISARLVSTKLILLGDHGKITTYLDLISVNPVVQGAIDLFGHAGAETMNFMIARMLLWRRTSISATLECSATNGYLGEANLLSGDMALSASNWQATVDRYPEPRDFGLGRTGQWNHDQAVASAFLHSETAGETRAQVRWPLVLLLHPSRPR